MRHCALLACLTLCSLPIFSQGPIDVPVTEPAADMVTLTAGESGIPLSDFLETWTRATERRFNYNQGTMKGRPNILLTGSVAVPKDKADQLFRGILVSQGFALVPTGPSEANLWTVEPIDSSRALKSQANYIPESDLELYRDESGQVIMTTIVLKHIDVTHVRGAVQQLLVNRNFEFAQEVPSANALLLVGFAPTLHSLARVLRAMDVPPVAKQLVHFPLKYANAREIEPIISHLYAAAVGVGQHAGQQAGPPPSRITILADVRTNSIMVQGSESEVEHVRRIVKLLDINVESGK